MVTVTLSVFERIINALARVPHTRDVIENDRRDVEAIKPIIAAHVAELEAERDRLREALKRIRDGGPYRHGGPGFDARKALEE